MSKSFQQLAAVLAGLWAGSLWTICALVAPTLFAALDDRRQAGRLAARFFHLETWIGVVIALLLIAMIAGRVLVASRGLVWLIVLTAAAPLASELILGPMMNAARAANDLGRFGLLHGVSAVLFFAAGVGGLVIAWRLSRPAG
jgi:Domain of unknown function (DUF4149)